MKGSSGGGWSARAETRFPVGRIKKIMQQDDEVADFIVHVLGWGDFFVSTGWQNREGNTSFGI